MTQASTIISKFPSMREMARGLGHKHPTTVQGWKESGFIPQRHHQAILNLADATGVNLAAQDFLTVSMPISATPSANVKKAEAAPTAPTQ